MKAVIQRVTAAKVSVDGVVTGCCENGLLVYLGVGKEDTDKDAEYLINKLINMRIFEDVNGKMNLSLKDVNGGILLISQFTLFADTKKGRRPSYNNAAIPEMAEKMYESFHLRLKEHSVPVEKGVFGAFMKVTYTNSGPVTIILDSKNP